MKDGHKIWSDLKRKGILQKGCECREGKMEEWKPN
jgi:hypothetical protein